MADTNGFDSAMSVNGGDLVELFGEQRPGIKRAMERLRTELRYV